MKQHFLYNIGNIFLFTSLYFFFLANVARAQTITENQPLSFGKIVLVDNAAARKITLFPTGGFTADPEVVFFSDPQLGNITVEGYPPLTPLIVSVGLTDLTAPGGAGGTFSLSNSFTFPPIIITNLSGSATFDVGATLSSDGSGLHIPDGLYDGSYTVMVTGP